MTAPFSEDVLRALFEAVPDEKRIAVAVSGGGDSMALLHLAVQWSRLGGPVLDVLTVDHGLRPESAAEAQAVGAFCAAHDIVHETLHWQGGGANTPGNLSSEARNARYTLMARACAARGIGTLLTGHTLDDQAETLLMRLGRGSGVDGLAAMRPVTSLWGLCLVRPLLGLRRAALREMLVAAGVPWSEDPTNEDRHYQRITARDALAALAPLGITPERLASTATAMGDARAVLDERASALAAEICTASPLGYMRLDPGPLTRAPRETARRLLARLLCGVSGNAYRPRLDALSALLGSLGQADFRGATLHGCRIDPAEGRITIQREPNACTDRLSPARDALWDNRFEIALPAALQDDRALHIAATGEAGLRALKAQEPPLPDIWRTAPRAARWCTPALWRGPDLLAIPLAGYCPEPEALSCRVTLRAKHDATMVDPDPQDFI